MKASGRAQRPHRVGEIRKLLQGQPFGALTAIHSGRPECLRKLVLSNPQRGGKGVEHRLAALGEGSRSKQSP